MASRIKFGHCVVFPDPVSPATMTWVRSLQGFLIFEQRGYADLPICSIFHVVTLYAGQRKLREVFGALQGTPPPGDPAALRGRLPEPCDSGSVSAGSSTTESLNASRLRLLSPRSCESL